MSSAERDKEETWRDPGNSTLKRQTQPSIFPYFPLSNDHGADPAWRRAMNLGSHIGDVWGRVSRVQCTWPSGRVLSSAFLPSALQAVKPRAKQTQKQSISEYDFTSAVGTYTVAFSMITGPECINRHRRKFLKARGLYSSTFGRHRPSTCIWAPTCWALCFELSFVWEGCSSISVERMSRTPPGHRLFALPWWHWHPAVWQPWATAPVLSPRTSQYLHYTFLAPVMWCCRFAALFFKDVCQWR